MKKTILITGSTDGIGKLVATKLAKDGHTIYLHGRNAKKLETVISEIKEASNNQNISGFVADFSDLKAVKNMASKIMDSIDSLDVLINNAGVLKSANATNSEGLELRFVVNFLAPYLLTNSLLPLLQKSENSRIVNLSSAAQAPVSLNVLSGKQSASVNETYAQSKLALTMWSFKLAEQIENPTVIAVNPGSLLNTKMAKEAYGQHWSSADKGGNILYDLAVSIEYNGVTGQYFDNDKGEIKGVFAPAHPDAYNTNKIEALINATKSILAN